MHKNKKQRQKQETKKWVYYKIDLTQVLKVYLEVMPLKSLGSEFQSFAPIYSNDFLYQFMLGR